MAGYMTEQERYRIEALLKDGHTIGEIAARLGRHYNTVWNEKRKGLVTFRNSDWTERTEYCADAAQRVTEERSHNKGRDLKIGNDLKLIRRMEYLIGKLHYSPYAAVMQTRKEGGYKTDICRGTVYNYIDKGIFLNISNKDLYSRRTDKKQGHRAVRPAYHKLKAKSINERPKEADRNEYGHWEMDTVYSGRKKSKACLLVLTDRLTRDEYMLKMDDRTLESTARALDMLEKALGAEGFRRIFKTITVDNGSEFSDAGRLETSCIDGKKRTSIYFCHPYSSFERGSNENANKLIRRWIKKGEDIGQYTDRQIQDIQDWINNYPRALFGGLSTNEYKKSLGIS